jgi:multidrug efflux pump subunit AcrA (membrane-fusion protein)
MSYFNKLLKACVFIALALPLVAKAEISKLETVLAEQQVVTDYHQLDAQIEVVNKSTVSAQTGGLISKLTYDVGDYVEKGKVIARISSEDQKSSLQAAKASVSEARATINSASASIVQAEAGTREAQANYVAARAEFNRVKSLFDKRILTKSQYDQAEAVMKSSQARVQSAKASLSAAKAGRTAANSGLSAAKAGLSKAGQQLAYTEVIAPYSGIVTERHVELGEVVSAGSPIMTGISLKKMRSVSNVPQGLILDVRKYKSARIYINDDKVGLQAKEITFFPYADAATNAFEVRLSFDSASEGLFPGIFVKIGFEVGKEDHLVVPESAIAYRSEVTGIYVIDDKGIPSLRQVRLGKITNDGKIRILSGLDAGEKIATDPVHAAVYLKQLFVDNTRNTEVKQEGKAHE